MGETNRHSAEAPSIEVKGLSYNFQDGSPGLQNVSLDLPGGSRTLLIGGMAIKILPLGSIHRNVLTSLTQQTELERRQFFVSLRESVLLLVVPSPWEV